MTRFYRPAIDGGLKSRIDTHEPKVLGLECANMSLVCSFIYFVALLIINLSFFMLKKFGFFTIYF